MIWILVAVVAWVIITIASIGFSRAAAKPWPEQGRTIPRGRPTMTFTPCSPKHKACSPAHSALVQGYRDERHRQEVQLEGWTGGYVGDVIQWMAKGGKLIDFRDWLKAHREEYE